jgi:hypothetical protein
VTPPPCPRCRVLADELLDLEDLIHRLEVKLAGCREMTAQMRVAANHGPRADERATVHRPKTKAGRA